MHKHVTQLQVLLDRDPQLCPAWPPDVFAVAASYLERTGSYVWASDIANKTWSTGVYELAKSWEGHYNLEVSKLDVHHPGTPRIAGEFPDLSRLVPSALQELWSAFVSEEDDVEATRIAALKLLCVADDACAGFGITKGRQDLLEVSSNTARANNYESLCSEVRPQYGRVLPKQHTPQKGMTLRSLSHHLAWIRPSGVKLEWKPAPVIEIDPSNVNVLVVPWPFEISPDQFSYVGDHFSFGNGAFGGFTYAPKDASLRQFLSDAIDAIEPDISGPLVVLFPELSLTEGQFEEVTNLAVERGFAVIAGVAGSKNDTETNEARVLAEPLTGPGALVEATVPEFVYTQSKHHRWCLDRNQIVQYGLGGVLPTEKLLWEVVDVSDRKLRFHNLCKWLTYTVLICEDLARQDPVSSIVRSVGPNLVVALLMDGPQMVGRWSSRYASVFADDPGSSVLSVTSLGMSKSSSQQVPLEDDKSMVVGLWTDAIYGDQELTVDYKAGENIGLLSLSCASREEWTADGRGDGLSAHYPVYSGWKSYSVPFRTS